jgi:hypothetical protein
MHDLKFYSHIKCVIPNGSMGKNVSSFRISPAWRSGIDTLKLKINVYFYFVTP